MASAAQLAARPAVPRPPDGMYAVPNPDHPHVLTMWEVSGGQITAWPYGVRWAPRPPRTEAGLPPEERRAQRERWYASTYWPWKLAVAAAIVDDPDAAADRFRQAVPEDARPAIYPTYAERRAAERDELRQQMRTAAVLHRAGLPYRYIAQVFSVSGSTAWRWTRQGLAIWEQEHRPEDLAAVVADLPPLAELREITRPPEPEPVQEDETAALVAWAAARLHVDPEETAALLAAVETDDWADLLAVVDEEETAVY